MSMPFFKYLPALWLIVACAERPPNRIEHARAAPVARPHAPSSFARSAPACTRLLFRVSRAGAAVLPDPVVLAQQMPGCGLEQTHIEQLEVALAEPFEMRLDLTGNWSLETARCVIARLVKLGAIPDGKLVAVTRPGGVRVATPAAIADGTGGAAVLTQRFEELSARADYALVSDLAPGRGLYELSGGADSKAADAALGLSSTDQATAAADWLTAVTHASASPELGALRATTSGSSLRLHLPHAGLALATTLKREVLELFRTPSGSMQPTLVPGDHLVVLRETHDRAVERGDLVAFASPRDVSQVFVKRVIGVAGDRVEIDGYRVSINGVVVEAALDAAGYVTADAEPLSGELWHETVGAHRYQVLHAAGGNAEPRVDVTVEPDSVFVLGDSRDNSFDSRHFGSVDRKLLRGRAVLVWASFSDTGVNWQRFGLELD
jgi:signal peptidase I